MPKVVVEHGELLDATNCFRCGELLSVRTKSFFTGEPIGRCCMKKEDELKEQIENSNLNVENFRNCGYIPTAENKFKRPYKKKEKA